MIVKYKMVDGGIAPSYATDGSAGLDLYARFDDYEPVMMMPGERRKIGVGVKIELPYGTVGLLCSRSGWADKYGIGMVNGLGIIDDDYRGEMAALLVNHGNEMKAVKHGDKIAQLVVVPRIRLQLVPVDSLDATERGEDGFGSTDK